MILLFHDTHYYRGRLNVLANVARQPLEQIFCEFQPTPGDEHEVSNVYYYNCFDWLEC